jgi:hypothetical protein
MPSDNTQSTKYLITVKDILKNKVFIYDYHPISFDQLMETYYRIYNIFKISNPNLFINASDTRDSCEIYQEVPVVRKGWLWNDKVTQKSLQYELTCYELLSKVNSYTDQINQTEDIENLIDYNIDNIDNIDPVPKTSMLSYGYSNNILFPHVSTELTRELKQRLTYPHFGLRKTI